MFKEKFHIVHLNLAIALLLALIMFVSGVETAKSNRVRTNTIQYILYMAFSTGCLHSGHFNFTLSLFGCVFLGNM